MLNALVEWATLSSIHSQKCCCCCCCCCCCPADSVLFQGPNDESNGLVRARAQAGQGQTVALGRNVMRKSVGDVSITLVWQVAFLWV
jgi:hypothetical protein